MSGEAWYGDFLSTTGFGTKLMVPQSDPNFGAKEALFQKHYAESAPPPPATLGTPGSVNGPGAFLSGQMPVKDSLATTPYGTPFPKSNILLNKDGTKPLAPTQQRYWQAVDVGRQTGPEIQARQKEPASEFIPGKAPTGGFRVEAQTGGDERNPVFKYTAIGFGGVAILSGLGIAAKKDYEKQFGAVAVVSLIVAIAMLVVYSQSGGPEKMAGYIPDTPDGRKLLMKTGFSPPTYPRQADQPDPVVAAKAPDPEDDAAQRYHYQGQDPNTMEGPRKNIGYRRSVPTPDGRQTLKPSELMRSAGNYNMDPGTFNEFMRRMNGEAPPQIAQSHPYYTFNAEWDHRAQIDDSARYHGIADEPGQMHRKSIYREPKLQQAGARRMHLKDPPPGAVMPLQKTHPWLERDESGMEPAFLAAPNEKLIAQINKQNEQMKPIMEQSADPVEAKQFVQERMAINPAQEIGAADEDFLKTESVISDKKKRIASGNFAAVPERQPLKNPGPPPPELLKSGMQPVEQPQDEQPAADFHRSFNEEQSTDEDEGESDMFLSAFAEKKTPGKEIIERAMNDVRRN